MTFRTEIPRDKSIDSTHCLLKEGYRFIPNRRRRFQSDLFETRLFGQKVICISGVEAAEIFYNTKYFKRKGTAPKRIQKSLFGEQGVQTLDDDAHERRKALFMSLFSSEHMNELMKITTERWEQAFAKWVHMHEINFFQETKNVMCQIACQWTDVPLKETEVEKRASDLWDLVDAFGAAGARHWRGRMARKRCEKWISSIIGEVRSGQIQMDEKTALYNVAWHRDIHGKLLKIPIAAVELLNILRPIVAISLYIVFGMLALHTHPKEKKKLQNGGEEYTRMFTQEVRRYYPFTPFVGARVREDFIWSGHAFKQNTLVLLDVYGMNHDHTIWESPSEFKPERFANKKLTKYEFIPQGGGEFIQNHRCAGELVTVAVMERSFDLLTKRITYTVPKQKITINLKRMPPKIRSGFIISGVKKTFQNL